MSAEPLLPRRAFERADLPALRHLVAAGATRAGLDGTANGAFVQAALEIATNAVVHAGGHGTIELRVVGQELRCEVRDGGPGMPDRADTADTADGQGLRLAEALTERLDLSDGPGLRGTTVTLRVRVPASLN